jgi:hypothetical protein
MISEASLLVAVEVLIVVAAPAATAVEARVWVEEQAVPLAADAAEAWVAASVLVVVEAEPAVPVAARVVVVRVLSQVALGEPAVGVERVWVGPAEPAAAAVAVEQDEHPAAGVELVLSLVAWGALEADRAGCRDLRV